MDAEKIYQDRVQRIRQKMEKAKVGALVLFKPQNTFYVSNFNAIIYSRPVIVTLALEKEPSLIVPRLRWDHAKEESRVKNIRVYHKIRMSKAPSGMAADPLVLLKDVLQEQNADRGTIGIENDYLTMNMYHELREMFPKAHFVDIAGLFQRLRMVKDTEELEMIRRAAEITDVGIETAMKTISEGTTEIEVSVRAMNAMNEYWKDNYPDSEVSDFGCSETWATYGLWCYCLSREGSYGCEAPSSRRLRNGDNPFTVCTAVVNGYHCENERTPSIGEPTREKRKVFEAVLEATGKILGTIRPGVTCSEVAEVGAEVYREYGYAEKTSARAGHSLGLSGHEEPSFALGEKTVLEENMVMSVEPALTVENVGTISNSNVGIVTEDGFELLTKYRVNELLIL